MMITEMSRILSNLKLLPCGHSIGIKLLRKEFKIIDLLPVKKKSGLYYYPASKGGLKVNDRILEVEGHPITSEQELHRLIQKSVQGKEFVEIQILRHGQVQNKKIKPYLCPITNQFKLGVKIRALDDGLGTLTFYDPITKLFGALGHPLCRIPDDPINQNTVVCSNVSYIRKGGPESPGKKFGYLNKYNDFTGQLELNTEVGIFGKIKGDIKSPFFSHPLSLTSKDSIKRDQATIYTVVKGDEIETFNASILHVALDESGNKDLKICIQDPTLLRETGGIVCGMSGSPLVQNGKLIGAISYLTASDSAMGYAVSLENMLKGSGLLDALWNG